MDSGTFLGVTQPGHEDDYSLRSAEVKIERSGSVYGVHKDLTLLWCNFVKRYISYLSGRSGTELGGHAWL
jgi:hypothetical protein